MKRLLLAIGFVLVSQSAARATWSVIAVDQATGQVAIASATCVPQANFARMPAAGLKDIQAIVVPGKGVAAAQANVDHTRKNQELVFQQIEKGTAPDRIIEMLKADPAIETRQFGIVLMDGRRYGFSGTKNHSASLDVQGHVPGSQVYFSIQGNTLASADVVHDAVAAFTRATGMLTDRVMAAMVAADRMGGDVRCNCNVPPILTVRCTNKTADVAYILLADRHDPNGSSFNNGRYALYISVTDQNITPGEDANPVRTLRMRYDAWKRSRHAARAVGGRRRGSQRAGAGRKIAAGGGLR